MDYSTLKLKVQQFLETSGNISPRRLESSAVLKISWVLADYLGWEEYLPAIIS
jgi:hypothetical protein